MRIVIPKELIGYVKLRDNEIIILKDIPEELNSTFEKFKEEYKITKVQAKKKSFFDVFKSKDKYNVEPKNNVPCKVYGVPNPSKYNIKPKFNAPEIVYGIPNVDKYNIRPDNNVPREVYGIPNPNTFNTVKEEKSKNLASDGVVEENNTNTKEVVLKISHQNWGLIGPDTWKVIIWTIYEDLTTKIERIYNSSEQNVKSMEKKITKNDYEKILKNIELSKQNTIVVDGCDGSAWEIIQYENGQEIWKKDLGYIYGIKPLEDIAKEVTKLL